MSLETVIGEAADEAAIEIAEQLKKIMREIVSIPGDPKVRAKPFAPPRRITGTLLKSITRRKNRVIVAAPYARFLEFGSKKRKGFPHKFIEPAMKQLGLIQ